MSAGFQQAQQADAMPLVRSVPERCRVCYTCVRECPAKAITLPAWSDAVLLSQIEVAGP